jgi:hypothetical protein
MSLSVMRLFRSRKPVANAMVLRSFNSKFPKATHIVWQQMDVFKWHVNFILRKKRCTALFTSEGNWLETVTLLSSDKIPRQLQRTLEETNNSDPLQQIYYVQTPDRTIYEMNLRNGLNTLQLLFDTSGKIIGKMLL